MPERGSSVPGFDHMVDQRRYVVPAARCGVAQLFGAYPGDDDRRVLVGIDEGAAAIRRRHVVLACPVD